eukprot:gene14637-1687_t
MIAGARAALALRQRGGRKPRNEALYATCPLRVETWTMPGPPGGKNRFEYVPAFENERVLMLPCLTHCAVIKDNKPWQVDI